MRILLIHHAFLEKNDGGGSRFNEMTQVWANHGHEVSVLAGMVHYATGKKNDRYKGKYFHTDQQFYKGVDVFRCHVSESYNVNFIGRLWAYFSFVFSSIYAGLFKVKGDFDIIVVTSPPLFVGITAYILSILKRTPFVFEIRDLWPESAIDTGVLQNKAIIKFAYWFEGFIYKRAKLINVLTPAFKTTLIAKKNVPENKILCIPNAADFTLAETIQNNFDATKFRTELNLQDKFVITYVGAHGVANHLIQLVDSAEKLTETHVVFQLIGSGMEKEMLQQEVLNRKLDNVIFRDPVSKAEVFKYILASDMGASVLKRVDTFKTIYSNKTFDYMSCKKPVLLAIEGVSKQLIEEAACGIYVEPENAEDIAGKIKHYIANIENYTAYGQNGYNYAKLHFERKHLALKYLESLIKVVKKTENV
ncbi:glycosyltransferase family 4 protein [Lacinutrix sp. Hel_I_90]|uniref:glycosyltransferase family 4 protein n=1 Tax=Lacinutrix sp. Hel_I_90 TaxID=1249999 RepID=UPI0005C843B2|nr:glycosyltransferase family 4 protein [Lacinutrix sp. Hel_I_90]